MPTSGSRPPLLAFNDVEVGYGDRPVLRGVDLAVPAGQIVTVIGANGAGKSTLLKAAFGILRPSAGSVKFNGVDVSDTSSIDRLRQGMAYCPQGRCNFPQMSVVENLELGGYQLRDRKALARNIDDLLSRFPFLAENRRSIVGNLSGGQQQIVELAMSLVLRPTLLLIDEPSIGLAPRIVTEVFEHITRINEHGVTVLMVEQNARRALGVSNMGVVLELGRVVVADSAASMLGDEAIRRHYLGAQRAGSLATHSPVAAIETSSRAGF